MIDFHTHILLNIDDGAKNISETINLIKEAKEVGFNSIILTPHYIEGYYETSKKETYKLICALKNVIDKEDIKINLFQANEMYASDDIMLLLEKEKASTINDTSYVLFEYPINARQMNIYDKIYELQQNNLAPVLAHPERYLFLQNNPKMIYDLACRGVLMQLNYGSFIGQYGEKAKIISRKMLENNMVHFLGTDVHKENTIYPKIPQILENLEKIIGKEKLEIITTTNPKLALKNKKIIIEEIKPIELSLKEKMIMKI